MLRSDSIQKAVEVLSAIPVFAGLGATTLEAIARAAILHSYDAGQVVFLEGEPCAGLYIVQDGWLKVLKLSLAGREQVLRIVGPGETFSEIGILAEMSNPATVVALEPATVWLVRRETILQLLDQHPELARIFIETLAKRVLYLVDLVEDLSLRTVEARLARHLLERSEEEPLHRRQWATQEEIAARFGTVLDVLNRALHSLADEGLIRVARQQIQILDRDGLRAKAMLDN